VDPTKEVQAYKEAVRCGFKTQAEVVAEQGGDLDELLLARRYEVDMAEELDLYFDSNPENEHEAAETPEQEVTEEQGDSMNDNAEAEPADEPIA
jgi:capsid protein